MLLSNLEGCVRMCKSRCEREFKEKNPKQGESVLRKGLYPVGERNGGVGRQCFPHSRHLKLGMPPALPSGQDSGNMLE